jgi:hypothetical protein
MHRYRPDIYRLLEAVRADHEDPTLFQVLLRFRRDVAQRHPASRVMKGVTPPSPEQMRL